MYIDNIRFFYFAFLFSTVFDLFKNICSIVILNLSFKMNNSGNFAVLKACLVLLGGMMGMSQ